MFTKSLVAVTAAVSVVAVPAGAATKSHRSHKPPTLCERAYTERMQVIHRHGKRAPGRNVCRYGVKTKGKAARHTTLRERIAYLSALKRMNTTIPFLVPGPPRVAPAGTATPRAGGPFAAIRACESGGNYSANTGNGFYGAYQFDQGTWNSVGGTGNPANASPAEQDKRAAILYAQRGSSPWPVCGR